MKKTVYLLFTVLFFLSGCAPFHPDVTSESVESVVSEAESSKDTEVSRTESTASQIIPANFSEEAALKGNLVFNSPNGTVLFYVAKESQHLLPHAENDTRELVIQLENTDDIKRMIGEETRGIQNCEIIIRDYQINLALSASPTALLTHIAIDSLGEEKPSFTGVYGDGWNSGNLLENMHYAISDTGTVYKLGNTIYKTVINNAVDGARGYPDFFFLKSDGTLVDVNNNLLAHDVERCDDGAYYRGNNAYTISEEGEEVLIRDGVRKVWRYGSQPLRNAWLLDTSGNLCFYDSYSKLTLLCTDVADFDVYSASHQSRASVVYTLKSDNNLWAYEVTLSDKLDKVNSYMMAENVKHIAVATVNPAYDMFYITHSGELYSFSPNYNNDSEYIMSDVEGITDNAAPLAIKSDGSIWYWGFVPWQPQEHVFPTPGASVGETQAEPTPLSMDAKVNAALSRSRMEAWLADPKMDPRFSSELPNKLIALQEYYDYYSIQFRALYTEEELEEYKPK
jgi:hypothetical protein